MMLGSIFLDVAVIRHDRTILQKRGNVNKFWYEERLDDCYFSMDKRPLEDQMFIRFLTLSNLSIKFK